MVKFETELRRKKTFKIAHTEPGDFRLGYVLLPVGYLYNADIAKAKKGDILRLWNGGDHDIFAVRKLNLKKPEADILSRMRYGITIAGALQRWKSNAKLEGHGASAISTEECLWVVYDVQDKV